MHAQNPSGSTSAELQRLAVDIAGAKMGAGNRLRVTVNGRSMFPVLQPGDVIVIDPDRRDALMVGAVITFFAGETVLTHRIVQLSEGGAVTKGDDARRPDAAISNEQVIGLVLARERRGRAEALLANRPARFLAALSRLEGRLTWSLGPEKSGRLKKAAYYFLQIPLRWAIRRLAGATVSA